MNSERRDGRAAERRRLYIKFAICVGWLIFMAVIYYGDHPMNTANVHIRVKREQDVPEGCENDGKWDGKLKRCSCTLGWVGNRCDVWHNHFCYFENGKDYRGKLSVTSSGTSCLPWTTEDNSRFNLGKDGIGVHNYCRNPDNDEKGLWCYVGGEAFIGYCNATRCPDALKDLLLRNTTEIGTEDDTSTAVQFLFGPLISGVCVGVVFLLAFIAVAEYLRRRRYFVRRKKAEERKENKMEKGEIPSKNGKEKQKKSDYSKEKDDEEWTEIRPLGGIITVDVDTGKEKWHAYPDKGWGKASDVAMASNILGCDNIAYLREKTEDERRTSADSAEIGPPPPYNLDDVNEESETLSPVLRVSDDIIHDVTSTISQCSDRHNHTGQHGGSAIPTVSETQARNGARSKGKKKRRNRHRSESSRASAESNLQVFEEVTPPRERPVPKPRTSLRARQASENPEPRVKSVHTSEKWGSNQVHPAHSRHSENRDGTEERRGSRETSAGGKSRRRSRDGERRASRDASTGDRPRRCSRERNARRLRDSTDTTRHKNDDVTRHASEDKAHARKNGTRKTKRNSGDDMQTHERPKGDSSRRKKSVKDLASAFENQELETPYESADDTPTPVHVEVKMPVARDDVNSEQEIKTTTNSRAEPTTFL